MGLTVDADFSGGNVVVKAIDGDRLVVRQDQRDTPEWWFWWNFRVRGAAGRRLRVEFDDERGPVGPLGPAVRVDGGDWQWAFLPGAGGNGRHDDRHFVWTVPAGADEVRFAFSFPYQLADLERFIATCRDHPDFRVGTLAKTRQGRAAPLITLGDPASARRNVLLSCRHHACEAVASYVLEGIVEHALSDDGAGLRQAAAITIVPMVDLDGVENGDQGKSRAPHDHNRDYIDDPVYPTVRAIKELVKDLAARNLTLYFDLHCPWIRGDGNLAVFFPGPPEPFAGRLRDFAEVLKEVNDGALPYTGRFDIPFGTAWNVRPPGVVSSGDYIRRHGGPAMLLGATLETSYSLAEGTVVTPDAARQFGRAFGKAVDRFLSART